MRCDRGVLMRLAAAGRLGPELAADPAHRCGRDHVPGGIADQRDGPASRTGHRPAPGPAAPPYRNRLTGNPWPAAVEPVPGAIAPLPT